MVLVFFGFFCLLCSVVRTSSNPDMMSWLPYQQVLRGHAWQWLREPHAALGTEPGAVVCEAAYKAKCLPYLLTIWPSLCLMQTLHHWFMTLTYFLLVSLDPQLKANVLQKEAGTSEYVAVQYGLILAVDSWCVNIQCSLWLGLYAWSYGGFVQTILFSWVLLLFGFAEC